MIVRASLCALDWNSNVGRPHKLDELGKPLYREKVCILVQVSLIYSDFQSRWTDLVRIGLWFQFWWPRTQAGRTKYWSFVCRAWRVVIFQVLRTSGRQYDNAIDIHFYIIL